MYRRVEISGCDTLHSWVKHCILICDCRRLANNKNDNNNFFSFSPPKSNRLLLITYPTLQTFQRNSLSFFDLLYRFRVSLSVRVMVRVRVWARAKDRVRVRVWVTVS